MILKLGRYIKGYKKETFLTLFFIFLEVVFEVAIPFLIAKIVDDGIKGNDGAGVLSVIIIYGSMVIVFAILALIFGVLAGRSGAVASAGFAKNLRQALYYKVQIIPLKILTKFSTASLITRMTTDVTMTQQAFQMVIRFSQERP